MGDQTRKMRVEPGVRYILPRGGVSDEPTVLLRDTPEDRKRLIAALKEPGVLSRRYEYKRGDYTLVLHGADEIADPLIAALRGSDDS